jgi:hypothetical protein
VLPSLLGLPCWRVRMPHPAALVPIRPRPPHRRIYRCPLPRDDGRAKRATASTRPCSHPRTSSLRLQSQVYHVQRLTSYYTLSVSSISSLHMASPKPWQCIVHGSGSTFSSLCGRHDDDVKFLVCMQELSISQLRSPTKHLASRIV